MATGLNETTHSDALDASYAAWEAIYRDMLESRLPPVYGEYEPVRIGPTWVYDDGWVLPEASLGWGVMAWCSHWLRDKDNGPWVFTPEQARFVLWFFAVDPDSGRMLNDSSVLQRLKGWGKDPLAATLALAFLCGPVQFSHFDDDGVPIGKDDQTAWIQVVAVSQEQPLALDTPVRTPSGWTTMGDIHVGDTVFDSSGNPVRVARETEVFRDLDCYEVKFSDGESIVASGGHGWTVEATDKHDGAFHERTFDTVGLREFISQKRMRARIPYVALEGIEADLPVDPYIMGLWIGDGFTADSGIAIDWRDRDEVERIIGARIEPWEQMVFTRGIGNSGTVRVKRREGICRRGHDDSPDSGNVFESNGYLNCKLCSYGKREGAGDPTLPSLRERLREAGVLGGKFIPDAYLYASKSQRVELLRGLIDSDGWVDTNGKAGFVNVNHRVIDGFCELLTSLGYRWNKTRGEGEAIRVHFRPRNGEPVAHLARKASRQRDISNNQSRYKRVVSVERVDSVPVKCIGIDTADHLFVAGRLGTLTHNTKNTLKVFPWIITERFKSEYRVVVQKTSLYALGERQIQAVTASPLALEGGRPTLVILNEVQNWNSSNGGADMYGVLEGNSAKSEGGQARMLFICNAYRPGEESVGERIRLAWEDTQGDDAEFESFGLMYDSLEAPPHAPLELDAVEDVIKAVRGDAVWLDPERIANSIKNQTNTVSESRRKWYNQILAVADAWVDPADWRMCGKKRDLVPGEKIVLFFDGSKSGDHTALVGCCIEDGYTFLGGVWEPVKVGNDLWRVDREAVDIRVSELVDEYRVLGLWGDPSDARDDETGERYWEPYFDMWHKRWGRKFRLWAQRSGNYMHSVNWDMRSPERLKRFIEAAELFTTDVASHDVSHDMSPIMARHVGNARRRPDPRFGIGLSKATKDSDKKIDIAVCAVGARMMRREAMMDPRIRTGNSQAKSRVHIMR